MLKIATLFSGIGTPELALKLLNINYKIIFACEIDKFARQTYLANHNISKNIFYQDVTNFDASIYRGKVDMLIAGSPCQPFSIIGKKKGFEDKRGRLFFDMLDRVKECQPTIFVFENVKGLVTHAKGKTFSIVLSELKKLGYKNVTWKVLNAVDYGAFQKRKRLFIVASNLSEIDLNDLPKKKNNRPFEEILEINVSPKYWLSGKAKKLMDEPILSMKKNYRWELGHCFNTDNIKTPTILAHLAKGVPDNILIDPRLCKYGFWSCDYVGSDMCNFCDIDNGYCNYENTNIPTPAIRKLTPREAARLQGIPDDFVFPVSNTQAYKQIGNAMNIETLIALFQYLLLNCMLST